MSLVADLRFALRLLRRSPGFTAVALLVLALGIGANTAIFSLVRAVVDPLPYAASERLYFLWSAAEGEGLERRSVSHPDFLDWRREVRSWEAISGFANPTYTVGRGEEVERVKGELVSAEYFRLLVVDPLRGRTFSAEEDQAPGQPVAMIGHAFWQSRLGGAGDVLERTLWINAQEHDIVGVLPAGFQGVTGQAEIWLPLSRQAVAIPELSGHDPAHRRDLRWHAVVGRLKEGVGAAEAAAELRTVAAALALEYPATNADTSALIVPMAEQLVGDLRPATLVLLGAVVFVLLIACANLANLLLARALARRRETAVRLALGASRFRLARQWLVESTVLAVAGGVLGLALAFLGLRLLAVVLAPSLPSYLRLELDPWVLVFTLALTLLTGVVLGLAPALAASGIDPQDQLKEESGGNSGGRGRNLGRAALLVAEVALAVVLLVATGLMIRGFQSLERFDPGFVPEDRLALRFDLSPEDYPAPRIVAATRELEARIAALPSVEAVARASDIPFGDRSSANFAVIEGYDPPGPEEEVRIYQHMVGPGYFETLGIGLSRGRGFTSADDLDGRAVVVVSATMAERYWPGEDPIGRRLKLGRVGQAEPWAEVVGVVEDVHHRDLLNDPNADPDAYFPFDQHPAPSLALLVHSRTGTFDEVRRELEAFLPGSPLYDAASLGERLAEETFNLRFGARLMSLFALLALALAGTGVYGVMAYTTRQRTRELAIRLALGASRGGVVRLAVVQGLRLAVVGVLLGLLGAPALTGVLASLLPGVRAVEPLVFGTIGLLLLAVALLATYVPARRAGRIDPVRALKE